MKVTLAIEMRRGDRLTGTTTLYTKEVEWTVVPQVGDLVLVAGDDLGWAEEVRRVWWDATTGEVQVDIGDALGVADANDEGLGQSLVDAGWSKP